jgi:hypothetical protein
MGTRPDQILKNTAFELYEHWCAILGLNQLMLFAGPVVDSLR